MPTKDSWSPARYARNAAFVPAMADTIFDWLKVRAGERILDLGCGDGALTLRIKAAGAAVVGCDRSPALARAAQKRGLDRVVIADGACLPFGATFDAVFSNAALHWMRPPEAVATSIARALRPGGRLACELGGVGNIAIVQAALHQALARRGIDAGAVDPWYFPDAAGYQAVLENAGFAVERIALVTRPTPLDCTLTDWLETFASAFLEAMPVSARPAFLAEVSEQAGPELFQDDGQWVLDYVRLRVAAVKIAP